ncbi:MAG: hypothetical protein N2442_07120 [Spirochaetes bacterium]|nr:hypothetical protein [Spirochaetota bacterium]
MKRVLIVLLMVLIAGVGFTQQQKARTPADYVKELMALSGADRADRNMIVADRSDGAYVFVPLYKGDKVIGYGTWSQGIKIYNHREDLIAVINPDGTLQNFLPLDANERHPEMKDLKWRSKFFGMNYKRDFIHNADVSSGSTFSSIMFVAELKTMLFAFNEYVVKAGKLKQ